jgi:phosphoserine phosphatase RsbU/P
VTGEAARQLAERPSSVAPLRILLLEDSPLDAELMSAELEQSNVAFELRRVDTHAGFNAALSEGQFDIILSDYHVPGFDGIAALAAARLACADVPFLFVSGALGEERAIELLKRGATDYVLKDRLERLVPSVERALSEAREKAERRRAERLLLERERTLSTLMSNLPGMAFRRRLTAPWPFEFASEGCLALTGFPPEALYAGGEASWASIMHAEDVERFERESSAALTEARQLTITYRIMTRSGQQKWLWERSVAHYDKSRSLCFIEGFVTDISQQKAAEEAAQRSAEFEKQLIGIVSHDLRNPLNTITLGASLLLRREELDDKSTHLVRRIVASAERATRMIRDLLDFTQARLGSGIPIEPKSIDLHAHALQAVEELQHTHPGRMVETLQEGDTFGDWDPDRIHQVIMNLTGNALAYSPPDSVVTVRTRGQSDNVALEVHNFGDCIPPERLPQVFAPLSRGVRAGDLQSRSIGLGLFIVDSIVRAHAGKIVVRSDALTGTTFTVCLPRSLQATEP